MNTLHPPARRAKIRAMQAHLNDRRAQIVSLTLLLGIYLALAGIYLYLVPPLDGPDAGGHLRYVWFLQTQHGLPTLSADEAFVSHEVLQQPPLYYAVEHCSLRRMPWMPPAAR